MGNDFSKGVDSAVAIVTGIITGDITGGLAGAGAPWVAEQIKLHTGHAENGEWKTDSPVANLVAHAILGAVVAELQGHSGVVGGASAVSGELAAKIIKKTLYGDRDIKDLTEEEKDNISALTQLAVGLTIASIGGDTGDIATGIDSSKNAVENNLQSLVIARDELEKSKQWWLDVSNDNLHPIPASLVNVLIKGSVIVMDGTIGFVDTLADGTAVLVTCGVGDSYCEQAKADVEKAYKTANYAAYQLGTGQTFIAIGKTGIDAILGDKEASENLMAMVLAIMSPSKLAGFDKIEKPISKAEKGTTKESIIDGASDAGSTAKIPIDQYKKLQEASIKNADSDTLVLGKYTSDESSYISIAKKENATYFDMGNDWNKVKTKYNLTDEEMFNFFNVPVLDDAITKGKTIKFTHNPENYGGFLKQELRYLENKGYTFDADQMIAIPPKR